jgi:hypothetical protein
MCSMRTIGACQREREPSAPGRSPSCAKASSRSRSGAERRPRLTQSCDRLRSQSGEWRRLALPATAESPLLRESEFFRLGGLDTEFLAERLQSLQEAFAGIEQSGIAHCAVDSSRLAN